jgi:hypothetical protein
MADSHNQNVTTVPLQQQVGCVELRRVRRIVAQRANTYNHSIPAHLGLPETRKASLPVQMLVHL